MSKAPSIIPAHMQDVELQPRREGELQRTERNPQGVRQFEYTGTPVKTPRQLEDEKIIRQNLATMRRAASIAKKIETLLDNRRDPVIVKQFEELYAKVTA